MPYLHDRERLTVLFAGGGTGGHLMPGLSVAENLRNRFPDTRAVFVGTSKRMEKEIVTKHRFEFYSLPCLSWKGPAFDAPKWMVRSVGGLVGALKLVQQIQPDIVVGLGGHAALAPSLAGVLSNIPLALLEQNAVPGKVNRWLSWWSREIYVPWAGLDEVFYYPDRVHVTGNPVRQGMEQPHKRRLATQFGLSPRKRTLLVTGGSQGAQFINRTAVAALDKLSAESSWLQILHAAGEAGYEEVRAAYEKCAIRSAVYPFIDDMATAYALCDLTICRAGGTTLAELTAQGVPAVLIPLPSAANNHQRRNADQLARHGAAIIADQSDLTPERLARLALSLLTNQQCLSRMRASSLKLGRPAAAGNVAGRLLDLIGQGASSGSLRAVQVSAAEGG